MTAMALNHLDQQDHRHLAALVAADRCACAPSVLKKHSHDASFHPAVQPEMVIWPQTIEEIAAVLRYADQRHLPITAWGAGTSLEGNTIPLRGGIVLSFARMNRILNLHESDFQIDVQPGVTHKEMNHHLRHKGLFFPPDPGAAATIGGMIANKISGTRTVRYGSIGEYVQRLKVVLAGGEIIEIGSRASKSSCGFDLLHLFIGSEGMLGIVAEATLRLAGIQEESAWAVATFPTVEDAARAVLHSIRSGMEPAAVELLDPSCIEVINRARNLGLVYSPTLFIEMHGPTRHNLADDLRIIEEICLSEKCTEFRWGHDPVVRDKLFEARHDLAEMIARAHPDQKRRVIDVAVPISAYPELIGFARQQFRNIPDTSSYIFGHAGDGNLHLFVGARSHDAGAWQRIGSLNDQVVAKALSMGGTSSGEHGVGIGKIKFMPAEHGASLHWMCKIKHLFDPNGILNPGKMLPE
jgi:D-lactate dehydrogenase (cytochrome)